MTYSATLWRVELRAVAALFVVMLVLLMGIFTSYLFEPTGLLTPMEKTSRDLIHISSVGAIFTVLYGAPLYALATWRQFTTWYVALAIGAAPGTGLLFLLKHEPQLALGIAGAGIAVAFLTHISMRSNPTVERDTLAAARPLRER